MATRPNASTTTFAVAFACLFLPTKIFAQPSSRFKDNAPAFQSPNSLAMGGASVATTRGLDALFENPAALALSKFTVSEVAVVSPMVEASEDGKKIYLDVKAKKDAFEMLSSYKDRPQHFAAQNVTGVSFKRAAIGVLQRAQLDAIVGNDPVSGPVAEARAVGHGGVYLASARSFADDSIFLGITTKAVHKKQAGVLLSAFEAQEKLKGKNSKNLLSENLRSGTAVGADIGTLFRITEMETKPTLGVLVRDLGMNYKFGSKKDAGSPDRDKTMVDVGLSLAPGTRKSKSTIAAEVKDVANVQKVSIYKRLHLGAELNFQSIVGFMAGLGQGYPSFGCYLNIKIVRLEAGVFGKEMGQFSGDLKSRRYFARASVGWFE